MIDGYRFLGEENRLTEHASVWQRSAQHSSEGNSFTVDQSCLLYFFHVALNILFHSRGHRTHGEHKAAQTYATKSPYENINSFYPR